MKIFIIYKKKNEMKHFQEYFSFCSHADHKLKTDTLVYWIIGNCLMKINLLMYFPIKYCTSNVFNQVQTVQPKELFQNSIESRTITYYRSTLNQEYFTALIMILRSETIFFKQ